jgi:hypothetical protein
LRKKTTTRFRFDPESGIPDASISHSKAPRIAKQGSRNTKAAGTRKKKPRAKIMMSSTVSDGKVTVDLPLQTKSEANSFEPWRIKHARHKDQQRIVALGLNSIKDCIKMPCRIMLTRLAPDQLDKFDNLPMSFKYIVDAICSIITGDFRAGRADSDERISIACDQVKSSEYGVRIEVTWD